MNEVEGQRQLDEGEKFKVIAGLCYKALSIVAFQPGVPQQSRSVAVSTLVAAAFLLREGRVPNVGELAAEMNAFAARVAAARAAEVMQSPVAGAPS